MIRCEAPLLLAEGRRVMCGKCTHCMRKWAREIVTRAEHEAGDPTMSGESVMLSLTVNEEAMPTVGPDACRQAWAQFAEAFAKKYQRHTGQPCPLKWIAVPEFGTLRGRLHVHAIGFHVPTAMHEGETRLSANGRQWIDSEFYRLVEATWAHGFVQLERVKDVRGAVAYVVKYVTKGRSDKATLREKWKAHATKLRAHGLAPPSFEHAFWVAWPRGRNGGLSRGFAEAAAAAVAPYSQGLADVPIGRRKGSAGVTRYERRVMRKALGMDTPAHTQARERANPETWEMRARIKEAGSVDRLRAIRGHADPDIADAARTMAERRNKWGAKAGATWARNKAPTPQLSLHGFAKGHHE